MVDRNALHWHLQYNHWPPVTPTDEALESCEQAIVAVQEGNGERVIVGDRTARQIVDDMHLEDFLLEA